MKELMAFEGEYPVKFTWQEGFIPSKSVEILLAPARSVWDDHFDENDYEDHTISYGLRKTENGVFAVDIPLKVNTYHFLFRVNNDEENDFETSKKYNVTYLANGRKINYINVGSIMDILLNNPKADDQPKSDVLEDTAFKRSSDIASTSRPRVTGLKRFFICCTYITE